MKTFISTIRNASARRLFIFGVLAGLFFSSGEGIQLMPFPAAEQNDSGINVSVREENSKSYAFSVFSARLFSAFLKTKFQKDSNHWLPGEAMIFDRSESGAKIFPQAARNRRQANLRHVSIITDSQSNRAPPAAAA